MKTNRELIDNIKARIDESNTAQIHEILSHNSRRIPYIEVEIIAHAIKKYVNDFDPISVRALIDAGCNPFASPSNMIVPDPQRKYHTLTSPYDIIEDAWVDDSEGKPTKEFAMFLKEILDRCLQRHKEVFAGQSVYADHLIERAEGLRTEVEARLTTTLEGYENYITQRLQLGLD